MDRNYPRLAGIGGAESLGGAAYFCPDASLSELPLVVPLVGEVMVESGL